MPGSNAGLRDHAWIVLDDKLARFKPQVGLFGAFRLVTDPTDEFPMQDTGWVPNIITFRGVWTMLLRFAADHDDASTRFPGTLPDSLTVADINDTPDYFALCSSSSQFPYFQKDDLALTEISYANSNTRPAVNSRILAGAAKADGETGSRKLILSAAVNSGVIATTNSQAIVAAIGLFDQDSDGDLLAATRFTPLTISGAQTFTVFYSIGLVQAAET